MRYAVIAAGNRVSLIVDDSGPRIAPDERPKLFDRFHRATDKGNGAGLGLAIADSIVRATGGEWQGRTKPTWVARTWRSAGIARREPKAQPILRETPEPSVLETHPDRGARRWLRTSQCPTHHRCGTPRSFFTLA